MCMIECNGQISIGTRNCETTVPNKLQLHGCMTVTVRYVNVAFLFFLFSLEAPAVAVQLPLPSIW